MYSWSSFIPLFSPVCMLLTASPVIIGCVTWLGARRAIHLIASLSAFAYLIETAALLTGFPYGEFIYSGMLGSKFFGVTPWTVPLGWVPLVIASWVLAWQFTSVMKFRFLLTTAILIATDLVLDPAAVSLGFWKYAHPGIWGGVPYTNFLGWTLSGVLGCAILHHLTKRVNKPNLHSTRWLLAGFLPAVGTIALWIGVRWMLF